MEIHDTPNRGLHGKIVHKTVGDFPMAGASDWCIHSVFLKGESSDIFDGLSLMIE
jgi:hypothetical protein